MASEAALWKWLRGQMKDDWFAHRIENRVGLGTPDVFYTFQGVMGWIELKEITSITKKNCPFTAEQVDFAEQIARNRGIAFALVRVKRKLYAMSHRAMFHWHVGGDPMKMGGQNVQECGANDLRMILRGRWI